MLIQAIVIATFFAIVLQMSGIFMALLIVLLMLLGLYGLGIIVAGLTIALKQWWVVSEALSTLIVVVTPIAYPLAVLPLVLRRMSMFLPTTYGIIGVRHFLLGEELVIGLPTIIIRLFLILIVWLTFGMIVFLIMDRYGRKKGSLSIY